jgi:hypothetical protein
VLVKSEEGVVSRSGLQTTRWKREEGGEKGRRRVEKGGEGRKGKREKWTSMIRKRVMKGSRNGK